MKDDTPHGVGSLVEFIAYTVYRTRTPDSTIFGAMYLLDRLRSCVGRRRGSTGHRLFIAALMVAWKVISDQVYSNKSWAAVSRGMFTFDGINRMERDLCALLDWRLHIDGGALSRFEAHLRRRVKKPESTAATTVDALVHHPPPPTYLDKIFLPEPATTTAALSTVLESRPLASSLPESPGFASTGTDVDKYMKS